jgi:hypothetical protein
MEGIAAPAVAAKAAQRGHLNAEHKSGWGEPGLAKSTSTTGAGCDALRGVGFGALVSVCECVWSMVVKRGVSVADGGC